MFTETMDYLVWLIVTAWIRGFIKEEAHAGFKLDSDNSIFPLSYLPHYMLSSVEQSLH